MVNHIKPLVSDEMSTVLNGWIDNPTWTENHPNHTHPTSLPNLYVRSLVTTEKLGVGQHRSNWVSAESTRGVEWTRMNCSWNKLNCCNQIIQVTFFGGYINHIPNALEVVIVLLLKDEPRIRSFLTVRRHSTDRLYRPTYILFHTDLRLSWMTSDWMRIKSYVLSG